MEKTFNVTGICYPEENYMVDLSGRLQQTANLVDAGKYFVINRARQYGKSTMLWALQEYLKEKYIVIAMSFQEMSHADFRGEFSFVSAFGDLFIQSAENQSGCGEKSLEKLRTFMAQPEEKKILRQLFNIIKEFCKESQRPIVLMIDEVDSASNNQVFLDFLSKLRNMYLQRKNVATFQSVILAGVYDIKNLKQKFRTEEEHRYNSPWNIAADFDIDMSFSDDEIKKMLDEYESDHQSGMNTKMIARYIFDYTAGYPYLVSQICKIIDEKISQMEAFQNGKAWTKEGFLEAIKIILKEPNTLFDDMIKQLKEYPELDRLLQNILFQGRDYPFNFYNQAMNVGKMFGFLTERDGMTVVANRIFETHLYNYFLSEEMTANDKNLPHPERNQFIQNGSLDMDLVMRKFMEYYTEIYRSEDEMFVEEYGRKLFLLFLKPIINGVGNYYVEARTRDSRRTDIIVDYRGTQYVVELKIWRGNEYHIKGEQQLADYLDFYQLDKGYLLSFNFNKKKVTGICEKKIKDKTILEITV